MMIFARLVLAFSALLLVTDRLWAQNHSRKPTQRPPASGEDRPSTYFGQRVVVDGDSALVGDLLRDGQGNALPRALLRGYRRVAGAWQHAPLLTLQDAGGRLIDIALSDTRLVYSTSDPRNTSRRVSDEGANYLYSNPNTLWTRQQQLRSPNIESSGFLGGETALHADGSVFFATKDEDGDFHNEGVVCRFASPSEVLLRGAFK